MHGFANLGKCSKMHDCIDSMISEHPFQQIGISEVAFDPFATVNQFATAGGQVVQNDHIEPGLEQLTHHVSADVTSPTDNEYFSVCLWHG